MTPDKTPSDLEIADLRAEFGITSSGRGIKEFAQVADFARAVLAKWGSPVVAGEPWGASVGDRVWVGKLPTHVPKLAEEEGLPIQWLYTTPQPTQAQAGAVPLTDEGILEMADSADRYANAMEDCGALESYKQTWSAARDIELARRVEAAHGIKGGQP